MKVLVLGGGGAMGRVAVLEATKFEFVERVTVADLNIESAKALAADQGCCGKAEALLLDINDVDAMHNTIRGHDIVLNTVGPFYTLGAGILSQVIGAGRHYVDICDDWEPTLEMLALSDHAKASGVTAIIGLGASPGVTNMLAMKAAAALDEVDELVTCWSLDAGGDDTAELKSNRPHAQGASAAVVHWVQQFTGTIRVLADHGFQDVKPLQSQVIQFPGEGDVHIWSVGHPESVTLPRAVKGLRNCLNAMVGPESTFDGLRLIAKLVDDGELTVHQGADAIANAPPSGNRKPRPDRKTLPPLFAWASGRIAGEPAVVSAHVRSMPGGGMAGATSVPLSLALLMFAGDKQLPTGVFAPEEVLDPDTFLDLLAPTSPRRTWLTCDWSASKRPMPSTPDRQTSSGAQAS